MKPRSLTTKEPLLPSLITGHPLFHEGITESQAKDVLKVSKGNYLFCASNRENQLLLIYKASFRGNLECRSLPLTFNPIRNEISHSSLGTFSTLSLIANHLVLFLDGFADGRFNPTPVFSKEFFITKEEVNYEAISSLPNDLVKANIFNHFDSTTLVKARYVSRSWCSLVDKFSLMIKIDQQKTAENIERKNKIAFIFDSIKNLLPPAPEGMGNKNQKLIFANYCLTESQEYGSSILLSFSRIELNNVYLERLKSIGYESYNFQNGHIIIHSSNTNYRLDCLHGFVEKDIKSMDRFIDMLVLMCRHGGFDPEQSISYLEESYRNATISGMVKI